MCNDMCVDHGCMYITEKIRSNISILISGPFPRGSFLAIMGVMIEYIPRFIMYYYAWKLMERSELVMKIVEVPCFQSRPYGGLAARKSAHLVACTYINSLEKTFDLIINKYM